MALKFGLDGHRLWVNHKNGNAVFGLCYDSKFLSASPSLLEQHHKAYRILYVDLPGFEKKDVLERLISPFKELIVKLAHEMHVLAPAKY